jgi:UDP-glucose:(heptosyl)LPS alpha-1,3-glucosyltransferase
MRIAFVRHSGGQPTGEDRLFASTASKLLARGDQVTVIGPRSTWIPGGARHVSIEPLVLGWGVARRKKAFARSADKHLKGNRNYDVVVGCLDATVCDVVRVARGCMQTRVDHGAPADPVELEIETAGLEKGVFRIAVAPTAMVRKDLARRYAIDPHTVRVINEGVDLELHHPRLRAPEGAAVRSAMGLAAADFMVVLHAPEMDRGEVERILRIVPEIARERPGLRFALSGADDRVARAALAGAGGHVRIASQAMGPGLLAATDLLVLHTHYSPFASTTLQALASGVPVITSALDGACELIEQDVTGSVLVAFQDSQSLYRELAAWTKPERAREGGRLARVAAEAHGVDDKAAEMVALFDEVRVAARR